MTGGVYTSAGGDERTANTPDNPWPVRTVNTKIADWVHKLGQIWVEGQITQISRRPRSRVAFITLRDPAADMSVQVTCNPDLLDRAPVPLTEGSRVVMLGRPTFYTGRATLSLRVSDIRPVGIGELLARIERLRQLLAAEGLFDPRLKQPLPFLPKAVGLISGRASAAQRDVVAVATARWPSVRFEIRDATVQGPAAVPSILPLLADLDAAEHVEVIVIARGGGSVEDLLPFSDETLLRAVSACRTPVISAIGHEPDSPLLDHVADVRAATPTDAAKRAVPDVQAELTAILERATEIARTIADPDAASYEVEQIQRDADVRISEAESAQAAAERDAADGTTAGPHGGDRTGVDHRDEGLHLIQGGFHWGRSGGDGILLTLNQ